MESLRYYHYRKLSSEARIAYTRIVQAIKRFSSCAVINSVSNLQIIVDSVKNDNPHLFYVDWHVLTYSSQMQGLKTIVKLNYLINRTEVKRYYSQVRFIANKLKGNTDYSTIKNVHDYLAKTVLYNHDVVSKRYYRSEDHNIVGPLFEGKGVCEGISRAAQILLRILKIECTYQSGFIDSKPNKIRGYHAWNLIKSKGQVKKMDVTWDLESDGKISHKYFLVPPTYL